MSERGDPPILGKAVLLVTLAGLGFSVFVAHKLGSVDFLSFLSQPIEISATMTYTKSATWWCPSEMEWRTTTVSGDNKEKVCEEFRSQKAADQKECPPGPPPGPPPSSR